MGFTVNKGSEKGSQKGFLEGVGFPEGELQNPPLEEYDPSGMPHAPC